MPGPKDENAGEKAPQSPPKGFKLEPHLQKNEASPHNWLWIP